MLDGRACAACLPASVHTQLLHVLLVMKLQALPGQSVPAHLKVKGLLPMPGPPWSTGSCHCVHHCKCPPLKSSLDGYKAEVVDVLVWHSDQSPPPQRWPLLFWPCLNPPHPRAPGQGTNVAAGCTTIAPYPQVPDCPGCFQAPPYSLDTVATSLPTRPYWASRCFPVPPRPTLPFRT